MSDRGVSLKKYIFVKKNIFFFLLCSIHENGKVDDLDVDHLQVDHHRREDSKFYFGKYLSVELPVSRHIFFKRCTVKSSIDLFGWKICLRKIMDVITQ